MTRLTPLGQQRLLIQRADQLLRVKRMELQLSALGRALDQTEGAINETMLILERVRPLTLVDLQRAAVTGEVPA